MQILPAVNIKPPNMKFITIAATIFAVVVAATQAAPAFHKRNGGSLVNVQDVDVKVQDVANNLAKNAAKNADIKVLRRDDLIDAKVIAKDINVLSKNHD
ncbi:hypothetical protein BGZ70_009910 [Mortierella alpina]|uniref:Uncharacterized protein n=1 Tax=Mortierella alpina TaxID=64518 RepID=A0A9P6M091_MORAP|nr:hypothetical protein BGZ70_009910 [Mortierella alpina]